MRDKPYVLIVDDDPDIVEGIIAVLETRDYRLASAGDGIACMERIQEEPPDLLILDMMMPRMDGFAVIRELRGDPKYAGLPVIILTTVIEDAAYRRYELETGLAMDVQAYIEKPAPPDELLRHVTAAVELPYVIVADDDPDIVAGITTVLESKPYQVSSASDGQTCVELVRKRKPDLLILDLLMPRMDGFAVIRELRSEPQLADLPIIILTTVVEDASRRRYELETGQDMAVTLYMQKPVPPKMLLKQIGEVLEA
jgi:CheY-like chemotaxis protein